MCKLYKGNVKQNFPSVDSVRLRIHRPMRISIPKFTGRLPGQIVTKSVFFDSVGYIFRALSWLDIAKRIRNICALQYAAHDTRQGIEQLLFEELVLSVGTKLDRGEYEKCKGNSTKLHKIIRRLSPDYEKLAHFTQAIASVDPYLPPLETWDHKQLMKHWGIVSTYLHWAGEPAETVEDKDWVKTGIKAVEAAANHIWEKKTSGYTGIIMPKNMAPEIRALWDRFKAGETNLAGVKRAANIALPILRKRKEG